MFDRRAIRWLACLLALTVGLPLWQHFGMNRTITIDRAYPHASWSLDDRDVGGKSVASLATAPDAIALHCTLDGAYRWPYCGFGVWLSDTPHGYDLSQFKDIAIDLTMAGGQQIPINLYLLNANPAYSKPADSRTLKVNQIAFAPARSSAVSTLPIRNFWIAPWWVLEHKIPPNQAGLDLSNVTALQLFTGDDVKPGTYTLLIHSISMHGKWIGQTTLLGAILVLWMLSAVVYMTAAFWRFRREMRLAGAQQRELEELNAALKLERSELAMLATHDELTGLHNRIGLRNRLVGLAHGGDRPEPGSVAILFIDIDHFKDINDNHGHLAGDAVLRTFAGLLAGHCRSDDFLCRWGGEEFILLCADTPLTAACGLAEKLRGLIVQHPWPQHIRMSCSFGVAQWQPGEGPGAFLGRADRALYAAKQGGRDRVCSDPPAVG